MLLLLLLLLPVVVVVVVAECLKNDAVGFAIYKSTTLELTRKLRTN